MARTPEGFLIGHWTDPAAATGCTVILCGTPAVCAVDVRGGAPGTRETELLRPEMTVQKVDAIVLTGGSAFGLAAADGVADVLERRGRGFPTRHGPVPIVPAAVLFDLGAGDSRVRPTAASGAAAVLAAAREIREGRVGAGAGATAGKRGATVWGGIGAASVRLSGGQWLSAIAAVNSVGTVVDDQGTPVAGAAAPNEDPALGGATTLCAILTDATADRATLAKVAQMAHDALAIAIRPAHTPFDGDTVFAAASCLAAAAPASEVGEAAVGALVVAIRRAIAR